MRSVRATRYVTPLREGGSLPAIVEGDDSGLYVAKFRAAGLRVPELVTLELDPALGRNEPDSEIRDLLKRSAGTNLGLDYLPGSATFDPIAGPPPPAGEAAEVVWLDALVTNVDRTPRNPNLLVWHRNLWLIDHGAALYFHHAWDKAPAAAETPFAAVRHHVLLPFASPIEEAGERLAPRLGRAVLEAAVAQVPEGWLAGEPRFATVAAHRAAYVDHLARRLAAAPRFVEEAERARAGLV